MIDVDGFEEVTRIRMSVEAEGRAVYWVAAYLLDGLLIDNLIASLLEMEIA